MANKASGQGKIWKTVLAVVLTIAVLCALVTGGVLIFFVTPHTMHFDSVYQVSANKIDGKYLYHASSNGLVSLLKADDDLTTVYGSNGEDDFDLGEQDVRVKATGIDTYRTDNSGVFISLPAIVYEYVGE